MTGLERVARAMWDARRDRQPARLGGSDLNSWEAALPREREAALAMARAAITALMEPSTASLDAGVACALNITVAGEGGWTKYVTTLHRAMLQAALEGE